MRVKADNNDSDEILTSTNNDKRGGSTNKWFGSICDYGSEVWIGNDVHRIVQIENDIVVSSHSVSSDEHTLVERVEGIADVINSRYREIYSTHLVLVTENNKNGSRLSCRNNPIPSVISTWDNPFFPLPNGT